jgi:hypothetical protein
MFHASRANESDSGSKIGGNHARGDFLDEYFSDQRAWLPAAGSHGVQLGTVAKISSAPTFRHG